MKAYIYILFLLPIFSYAQEGASIPYKHTCDIHEGFNVAAGDPPATWNYSVPLTKYILERLDKMKIKRIFGTISINLIVYKDGSTCCMGFTNNTQNSNKKILALGLDTIINNMPIWKPAMINGSPINSSIFIEVFSYVDGHPRFDVELMNKFDIYIDDKKR